jgi:hypothetical protein
MSDLNDSARSSIRACLALLLLRGVVLLVLVLGCQRLHLLLLQRLLREVLCWGVYIL